MAKASTTRVGSIRDVASTIRGRRQDLGISQAQLAERAGVSRKWIYEFEGGKSTAELGLLLRVLDALDLALEVSDRTAATPGQSVDLDGILDEYRAR